MTTVGEFKKKLEVLPDSAQLEFWAVLDGGMVELTMHPTSENVRSPTNQLVEVLLTTVGSVYRIKRRRNSKSPLAIGKNVFGFPPTDTMTSEQALHSALRLVENGKLQDCLVQGVGYDSDGDLLVRSSRMDRKMALWFAEQLRLYALSC